MHKTYSTVYVTVYIVTDTFGNYCRGFYISSEDIINLSGLFNSNREPIFINARASTLEMWVRMDNLTLETEETTFCTSL